jgi:hypothetical protein
LSGTYFSKKSTHFLSFHHHLDLKIEGSNSKEVLGATLFGNPSITNGDGPITQP